tara:strand:- start:131 stop:304 length:174 start_codon:yes stop_codon:yes gene_type:complete
MSRLKNSNDVITKFLKGYKKDNITKAYFKAEMYRLHKLTLGVGVMTKRCKLFNIELV